MNPSAKRILLNPIILIDYNMHVIGVVLILFWWIFIRSWVFLKCVGKYPLSWGDKFFPKPSENVGKTPIIVVGFGHNLQWLKA